MTALLVLVCDGRIGGQPCPDVWTGGLVEHRGALAAALVAREAGWTTDGESHWCPSVHDEPCLPVPTNPNALRPTPTSASRHSTSTSREDTA